MRPLPVFAALLLLLPLIEIWLLIRIGGAIGALPTFLLLILISMAGMVLLRRLGFATLTRFQNDVRAGELPARALMEGALLVIGAILFVIPGFFTDLLGLLLILPPTRYWIGRVLLKHSVVTTGGSPYKSSSTRKHDPIEGEVVSRREDKTFLP